MTFEECVEELLPSRVMRASHPGQDAVEIEQNRVVVARGERNDDASVARAFPRGSDAASASMKSL
jgi:hypothetical protein